MPKLSHGRVYELETDPVGRLELEDHAAAGGFLHYCVDWDFLLIDQTDVEFESCGCNFTSWIDPKTGKVKLDS